MSLEQNKAVVVRFLEEAFTRGNLAIIDEQIAADIAYHTPDGGAVRGSAGVRQLVTGMRTTFPDLEVTPEDLIAEGDQVVVRFTDRGTHQSEGMGLPPTGRHVRWMGIDIFRIVDGKIAEGWGVSDFHGLMQQFGDIPPRAAAAEA
jgi:steroid delta-isomerase-like uncharacterized protein